jgi:hypothetical protein
VKFCRVSYRDVDGIEHAVEVSADSLYEAVAEAVCRFRRDDGWGLRPPGPRCEFEVKVLPDSPMTYSVRLDRIESFARYGTAKGPREVLRKNRIKRIAGL